MWSDWITAAAEGASCSADYVAIDLMAQAEHGPNGAALLVTWSESLASDVAEAIDRLLAESSRRADTDRAIMTDIGSEESNVRWACGLRRSQP